MQENSASIQWTPRHPAEDYKRSKHIDVKFHHIREKIASGEVTIWKMSSSHITADFSTKMLTSQHIREGNALLQLVDVKTLQRLA